MNATRIHVLAYRSKNSSGAITDYEGMREFLKFAKTLICHNCIRFDIPVLERLLGVDLSSKSLVDTLALSWYLKPLRVSHSLDSYGTEFLIFKPKVDDWENLPLEDYVHRCQEDVKINTRLWNDQYNYLKKIYGNEDDLWRLIKYLAFKLNCARLQEASKWRIDVEATEKALQRLEDEKASRIAKLLQTMPKVPLRVKKHKPKRFTKANGVLTKLGQEWIDLLEERQLPSSTEEIEITVGYEDPNPASTKQMKDWLFSLGWKPQTFKHKPDGEEIPQVNQPFGKGLDPGVIDLIDDHPELEFLAGLSVLGHRIGILKNFLSSHENGYLQAKINGLTNTLRFQHVAPCVNLPKPDRLFAEDIRSVLIADESHELCGADMVSLEDKLKQHYIFPYDPEYVKTMQEADFDPHLLVALNAEMLTEEEVSEYKLYKATEGKEGSKKNSRVRDMAKNGGYAMQYLAGIPRLMKTLGIDRKAATKLFNGYWKLNWAVKEFPKHQTVKTIDGQMWVFNPVSKLWLSLRNEKDIFSTIVQSTAAFVFDLWVRHVIDRRPQLTAQFHDEIVLQVKKGFRNPITKFLQETIDETNKKLKLNVPLGIGIQFGERYSDIH